MEYTTEHNSKGGFRFDIRNPPEPGTEMQTTSGEAVIFDEVSFAGMLACTRKSDGSQQLYFPHDLMGANVKLRGGRSAEGAEGTRSAASGPLSNAGLGCFEATAHPHD